MTVPCSASITIEISPGELIDKISILEIKRARMREPAKLQNVAVELAMLSEIRDRSLDRSEVLGVLSEELRSVNEQLWDVEESIRACEREGDFGVGFVRLARSVYRLNDRRSAIKYEINQLLKSRIVEEKSYTTGDQV